MDPHRRIVIDGMVLERRKNLLCHIPVGDPTAQRGDGGFRGVRPVLGAEHWHGVAQIFVIKRHVHHK